jgi:acetyl esterase/lipase
MRFVPLLVVLLSLPRCDIAAAQAPPAFDVLLQHHVQLKPELARIHPRVFVTAAEIEQLRVRAKTTHRELWTRAIANPVALQGPPPPPPGPQERRSQNNAAYAIVEISLAYAVEQRPEYLATARAWVLAAIDYEPWGYAYNKPNVDLAAGHLLYAIGWAYDLLYNELSVDERARIRKSLERHAALVYEYFSLSDKKKRLAFTQNHDFIPTAGLGIAALALMGESADAPKWAALSRAHQHRAGALLSPDGYYYEGMEYWIFSSPWLVHFLDAWEHATGESLWEQGPYRNWKYYVAHSLLPDGKNIFDFGDAWEGPLTRARRGDEYERVFPGGKLQSNYNVLYRVASHFKDPEAQAVAARLASFGHSNLEEYWTLLWYDPSLKPAPMSALPPRHQFEDSGVVFWRSGWDDGATAFAVKGGPPEGHAALARLSQVPEWAPSNGHAHPDIGSFIIYAQGRYLTGDTGYAGVPLARQHNTITIDGEGQGSEGKTHEVWEGEGVDPKRLDAIRITRADLADGAATIVLDAAGAYVPARGLTRFTRTFTFAAPGEFRVVDDVATEKASTVQWYLHSDTPFGASASGSASRRGSGSGEGSGQAWTAVHDGVALNVAIDAPAVAANAANVANGAGAAKVSAGSTSLQVPGRPGSITEGTMGERGYQLMIDTPAARTHRFDVRLSVSANRESASAANSEGAGAVAGQRPASQPSAAPAAPAVSAPPASASAATAAGAAGAAAAQTEPPARDLEYGVEPAGPAADSGARPIEFRDVTYSTVNGRALPLDLYQHPAASAAAPAPVFVYFHGGGWNHGARPASYHGFRPALAMGASVVSVEYRLAGAAPAPAAVQDARCALAWVKANAAKYHFDPARIIAFGTSAGAHLALMAGMPPPGAPDVDLAACGPTPPVAAIVDFYGITDVDGWAVKSTSVKLWLGDRPDFDAFAARMSPLTYVRPGLPPIFIAHGDADPTVPYTQSVRLHDALTKAGVPTKFVTVPGGLHGKFTPQQMQPIWRDVREFLTQQHLLAAPRP